jgi:hypothetical protein
MFSDFRLFPQEIISGLLPIFGWVGDFFLAWWWIFALVGTFLIWRPLYLWFLNEKWLAKQNYILLEIRLPREISRPIQAMEQVFSHLWSVYDPANFIEKWIEGKVLLNISLEIASIDGEIHFFIRTPWALREMVQSILYSQYQEIEISEVEDYAKLVPQKIPNRDWDLWGCDYILLKEDSYPIKTYTQFFERTPETKEEKRIDPLASLLEGMTFLKNGEQLWIQIVAKPITNKENDWVSRGEALRDKLVNRPKPPAPRPILYQILEILFFWRLPEGKAPGEEPLAPMMKLTSEEQNKIRAIEEKIGKQGFQCHIRFIYLGKKGSFFKPRIKFPIDFFAGLSTQNLNGLRPWNTTKVYYPPAIAQRTYLKKRDLLWHYIHRLSPLFPKPGRTFVLNTEELATIYHFPGKIAALAPTLKRIEAKKSEPPSNLPVEESS